MSVGSPGDDSFTLTAIDQSTQIDGEDGDDTLVFSGNFIVLFTFLPYTVANVEKITFTRGYEYKIALADATVAVGETLVVDASQLERGIVGALVDGSSETDGQFHFISGAGRDTFTGGSGNDLFDISRGNPDTIKGGAGDDRIVAMSGWCVADRLDGGEGFDTFVIGGPPSPTKVGDIYSGGLDLEAASLKNIELIKVLPGQSVSWWNHGSNVAPNKTLRVDGSDMGPQDKLSVNFCRDQDSYFHVMAGNSSDSIFGGGLSDALHGNGGDDFLGGFRGNDSLYGGLGNDVLDGGLGADLMQGGANNDSYRVDNISDRAIEIVAGGTDIVYASVSYALSPASYIERLHGNAGSTGLTLTGNDLVNEIVGKTGNDTLRGLGGDDKLHGGKGDDIMEGGSGNDTYVVDSKLDDVIEGARGGVDVVYVSVSYALEHGSEVEYLRGNAGLIGLNLTGNDFANQIGGLGGKDLLFGLGGNDCLTGGFGADRLSGGAGDDRFVFTNDIDIGGGDTGLLQDSVTDWASGDKIDLSRIDANAIGGTANDRFSFLGTATFSGVAGQLHYVRDVAGSRTFVEGDTNGDRVADFHLELTGHHYLLATDFVL